MIERSELFGPADPALNSGKDNRIVARIHRVKLVARRYWWIAAITAMIGMGIQDYRCLNQPARYASYSRMMLSGHLALQQGQVYNDDYGSFYGTQVALMQSHDTLAQAIDRVSTIYPEVAVDKNAEVVAGVVPRTALFDLKATSTNPEYAKLLLDAVMDTYLASKRGRKNQSTDEAVSAITDEIAHLDAEIRNDEQQLLDFQKENNVVFIEEQSASSAKYLVGLNDELSMLVKEHDLLDLENKDPKIHASDYTKSNDTNTAPGSVALENGYTRDATAIVTEQDYIEKLKILKDEYGVDLKDMHPKMVALTDSINKEEKFLDLLKSRNVQTRDTRLEDMELQIKNLQAQIAVSNAKSLELSERLGTYQQLKDKIGREQTLYNQLASSIQTVDMNKSLDQDYVIILEAASPAAVIDPNYGLQITYGLLAGLFVGVVIMYIVNRFDDKIDSPLELQEKVEFPIVGQIPLLKVDKKTKRLPLLTENDERQEFLEHHRYIRSALLFQSSDAHKIKSLMISSAAPGEGKSTLAGNLASVFAHSGVRTLLIDADLRRGIQHSLFEVPVSPGLSEFLHGKVAWREAIHQTQTLNLDVMPRGKIYERAGDVFLDQAADILLQETAESEYDLIIWDTAPLLAVNDAANLCAKMDGVLFVARVRHSTINSVTSALDELTHRGAKVFGIVLNAVEPNQPGYYDKYRYHEYYATPAEA